MQFRTVIRTTFSCPGFRPAFRAVIRTTFALATSSNAFGTVNSNVFSRKRIARVVVSAYARMQWFLYISYIFLTSLSLHVFAGENLPSIACRFGAVKQMVSGKTLFFVQ